MDSLSHFIHLIAPKGSVDLHCRFSGNWQADHPQLAAGHIPYHAILSGEGRLKINGQETTITAGDVLLLPKGSPHLLGSLIKTGAAQTTTSHFNGLVTEVVSDGEGPGLEMLCGEFHVGTAGALLFASSPVMLRVQTSERDDCQGLRALLSMLAQETLATQPGSAAIIHDLSTTLLTLLLRALLADTEPAPGVLRLLADSRLAPAIGAVLEIPEQDWTLAGMAERCHLSRATFARHFSNNYHLPPLEWLTQIRMALAARLFQTPGQSVGRVAEQCGYGSQASFTRVFKLHHGMTPGQYRRQMTKNWPLTQKE